MFKIFILSAMMALFHLPVNKSLDINLLRKEYVRAVEDADKTDSLLAVLNKVAAPEPLVIAYKGACEALRAKHAWNPYNKISHLQQGKKTMARAIALSPTHVEIRFLRFSLEHYLPDFLGESRDLTEDRKTIVANIATPENAKLGKEVLQPIAKFLIDSKRCTPAEVETLRKWLNG